MATLSSASRLVVKIGSALLVDPSSRTLRRAWLDGLAADVAWLKAEGVQVVLVSSGAIALGRAVLGLRATTLPLEQSQAAAAVGQIRLAQAYEAAFAPHGIVTAQILVTLEDSQDRRRYLNSRATLAQLLSFGTLPIVNENDTVATDEIRLGDNDRLAARVAATIGADGLVLLSDVDGLYTADPRTDPAARHLPRVDAITPRIEAMAGAAGSGMSRGGMKTKLMAARIATAAGAAMAICKGDGLRPLRALEDGARATWFAATIDPQTARKNWIAAMKPLGRLCIDAGAVRALAQGKSLLPPGVTAVSGTFGRGDPVWLDGPDGTGIGIGLCRYTSDEVAVIKGHHSNEIVALLGYPGRAALVHRDDLAI